MDDKVKEALADWIDSGVIAEAILEDLEEAGIEPTLENAQKLWLDSLETELHSGLSRSITAVF